MSRSPTASSCTSGYVSHSASDATLSDVPFSTSESSEHLSCTCRETPELLGCPTGRTSTQTKNASVGGEAQQRPPPAQNQLVHSASSPISIPNCLEKQRLFPHSCVLSSSQEFTDFKGADDSIREEDLAPFTEGWGQEETKISTNHQKKPGNIESCDTDNQLSSRVSNNPEKQLPVSAAGSCTNTTPLSPPNTSLSVPLSTPPPPVRRLPAGPAQRAGGEPPIQEPAQGDLPHGSPCPSPNPSSAEPSGDSSGDDSTPVAQLPDWMAPGEQVWVGKRRGTVYYVGGVEFAKGIWIGVKLDMAVGKSCFQTNFM